MRSCCGIRSGDIAHWSGTGDDTARSEKRLDSDYTARKSRNCRADQPGYFAGTFFGGGVVTLCQIFTIDGHANQIAPATAAMPMRFTTW